MTYSDWTAVVSPKVDGTWNLHSALLGTDLDFFLLSSSVLSQIGQPGQANYGAANTFLDAFVQYRHSLGLPASVSNIGVVKGIGFAAENIPVQKTLKVQGHHFLGEQELLNSLQFSIL